MAKSKSKTNHKIIRGLKIAGGIIGAIGGTALAIHGALKHKRENEEFDRLAYQNIDNTFPLRTTHTFADDVPHKFKPTILDTWDEEHMKPLRQVDMDKDHENMMDKMKRERAEEKEFYRLRREERMNKPVYPYH